MGDPTENDSRITHVVLTNTTETEPRFLEIEKDDFVRPLKVKIGDLVSKASREAHNLQTIAPGSTEVTIKMPNGDPAPIGPSKSADQSFIEQVFEGSAEGQKAIASFDTVGHLFDYTPAKGKGGDPTLQTIDDITRDINENMENATVNRDISVKLGSVNALSDRNIFLSSDASIPEDDNPNLAHNLQTTKGLHTPAKWPEVAQGPINKLTIQDLKNIGLQMMLEGSGEIKVPKEKDKPLDNEKLQAKIAVTPGLARLGLRVPYTNFQPGNIMEQVNPDYKKPGSNPLENEASRLSHGHYNNPLVPFDSLNTTTNRAVSGILILAISQMVRALGRLINTDKAFNALSQIENFGINNFTNTEPNLYDDIQKRLGSSKGSSKYSNGVWFMKNPDDLLFSRNYHSFGKAVDRGVVLFFELGTDSPLGLLNPVIRSFTSNTNPGYYSIILRMLINDVNSIFSSLVPASLTSVRGPLEINRSQEIEQGNPASIAIGALDNTLNLIGRLKDSKLLRFIDILATIGDLSLSREGDRVFTSVIDGIKDYRMKSASDNESLIYNNLDLSKLISKNRLSDQVTIGRGNLAWGSNKTPSLYMFPGGLSQAESEFDGGSSLNKSLTKDLGFTKVSNNRLSMETVVAMEAALDSSYMPFYFQDLRTNEIISFHAFIEGISDGFDVDYTETQGIGRIESVYKYKSTKRDLSVTFYVVATNPQDFDEMWLKVNKLVMMLYPQYTAGREVLSDGNKFIQPMSQLVGASPLVRMRIGDIVKTNHSDFDSARLFGLGTGHFALDGSSEATEQLQQGDQTQQMAEASKALQVRKDMINGVFARGMRFRLTRPYGNIVEGANFTTPIDLFPGSIAEQLGASRSRSNPNGAEARIWEVNGSTKSDTISEIKALTPFVVIDADPKNRRYTVSQATEKTIDNIAVGQQHFTIQFRTNSSDIALDSSDLDFNTQVGVANENANSTSGINQNNAPESQFFNSANNPIFQSFDSVRGQGLAGFIRSLRLDYAESSWEVDGINNRAPKWLKIELSFAPVHDIAPGLDSNGFMTGAPYNIGEIMKTLKKQRKDRATDLVNGRNGSES